MLTSVSLSRGVLIFSSDATTSKSTGESPTFTFSPIGFLQRSKIEFVFFFMSAKIGSRVLKYSVSQILEAIPQPWYAKVKYTDPIEELKSPAVGLYPSTN